MAILPRVTPTTDITCGKHDCAVVFYHAPGPVRPYVISCQNLKCGNKGFVRADDAASVETVWRAHLEAVECNGMEVEN